LIEYIRNTNAKAGDLFDSGAELDALLKDETPSALRLASAMSRIAHVPLAGRRVLGRIWRQPDLYKINASPRAIFCVCKASAPRTVHVVFTGIVKGKPDLIDIRAEITRRRALTGI